MKRAGGTDTINYSLYPPSKSNPAVAGAVEWGAGIKAQTIPITSRSVSLKVFGVVPAQATPPPGIYSDTVVVILNTVAP